MIIDYHMASGVEGSDPPSTGAASVDPAAVDPAAVDPASVSEAIGSGHTLLEAV